MISELNKIFPEYKIINKKKYYEILVDKDDLYKTIKKLKENQKLAFDQLIDITAVDYPSNESRFELIYIFLSMVLNERIIKH